MTRKNNDLLIIFLSFYPFGLKGLSVKRLSHAEPLSFKLSKLSFELK
jgi:hypothetical protein